tara:strand:- start:3861 stop:5258 length:1398 start_codon:yes stop_codon:yes gene_type:complete
LSLNGHKLRRRAALLKKDCFVEIVVIGAGYIGLVTAACFAEMGNRVHCVDPRSEVIQQLNNGLVTVAEPGLERIVLDNYRAGRLLFGTNLGPAVANAAVCFLAIGNPGESEGVADAAEIIAQAAQLADWLQGYTLIATKSTVPVGTTEKIRDVMTARLADRDGVSFDVVANPEFMKEGSAIDDFMSPDRIIVGLDCDRARTLMEELYQGFSRNRDKMLYMGIRDAEMTKFAATAMLATRISFMNEMATLSEYLGVDIEQVRKGIGSDSRIGYSFIYPGCGYGGSCFPRDVRTLIGMARENGFEATLLDAVEARNQAQKRRLFEKLAERFGEDMQGKTIAVWGLAFKPGTADMHESSAIALINQLVTAGAQVRAYDPMCNELARQHFPSQYFTDGVLELANHQYDAVVDADALVLVTEWKPFRQPDFIVIKKLLRQPVIIDGRNQYDPQVLLAQGFDYSGVGRNVG